MSRPELAICAWNLHDRQASRAAPTRRRWTGSSVTGNPLTVCDGHRLYLVTASEQILMATRNPPRSQAKPQVTASYESDMA
jgi:hypothetical protein